MSAIPKRSQGTTVAVLLLVPLLLAGGLLWGTWNAADRLHSVQAAVVNLDKMVTINGQPMPLGRLLAAELVDSSREQNLTWVLANEEGASRGLASGRFAAVVTIPEEFSAAATSFSGAAADAVQATIAVQTSQIIGVNETALGQSIADAAANSINRFLTGEYLKGIYLGFNQMSAQFVELRDGTAKLADGAAQLADGADQSADGAGQLADGLGTISAAGGQLADGANQSADGARQLAGGAAQLTAGAQELASGTGDFASGVGQFATGVGTFADGVALYTDGVSQYVGVVNPMVAGVRDFVAMLPDWDGLSDKVLEFVKALPEWAERIDAVIQDVVARLHEILGRLREISGDSAALDQAIGGYRITVAAQAVACPAELAGTEGACDAFAQGVAAANASAAAATDDLLARSEALSGSIGDLVGLIEQVLAVADRLAELSSEFVRIAPEIRDQILALTEIFGGKLPGKAEVMDLLNQFVEGGNQIISGGAELADGASQLSGGASQLADGASQLADGVGQYAGGVGQFGDGVGQLAGGLGQLADGVGQYTGGVTQVADGSSALASGLDALADGAGELSSGVSALAAGVAEGAGQIPTYTDAERENLALVAASPIDTSNLTSIVQPRVAWASLLLVVALWLGAMASYAAVRAIDPRNAFASGSNAALLWQTLRPGLAIGAVHAVAMTTLGAVVVGLPVGRSLGLAGVMLLSAAAFAAVNHALTGLAGNPGRLVCLLFLLVSVVPALSSAAPGFFDGMRALSPLSPALDAVRGVMTGGSYTTQALLVVAWLVIGVTASGIAVARSRTVQINALLAA